MGWFEERPVMVVGQQKGRDTKQNMFRNFGHAAAGRLSQGDAADGTGGEVLAPDHHAARHAGRVSTARTRRSAARAEAIAQNLREMSRLGVPVIVVVIGEGGSGGALALGVGNRIYMLENAVYSVISPESCAAIIYRDSGKAPQAAAALKMTAPDLLELGLIDGIVPEPGEGAHTDPDNAAEALGIVLREASAGAVRHVAAAA